MPDNNDRRPLMGTTNILGKQNNGFKNTAWAIAEIVDNSIQAGAHQCDIIIIGRPDDRNKIQEIILVDDGCGMSKSTFSKALQFSSGSRSGATKGLGKYGQGLPNSSVSQTKRVEVYTSQGNNEFLYNYLDLDEIHETQDPFLPEISNRNPHKVESIKSTVPQLPSQGTIVRWINLNRANPKTLKTSVAHIEKLLGRIFRYYILGFTDSDGKRQKCTINILSYHYNGEMYTKDKFHTRKNIRAFDPMFLSTSTQDAERFPQLTPPFSVQFTEPVVKTFQLDTGEEATVTINFSYCPREHRDKFGRNAGATDFGSLYLKRNLAGRHYSNISIVRAGREIDSGHFDFIQDISDPTHRWWSAEVRFEPMLDDLLGVDYTKQRADNIKFINADSEELQDNPIASWISNTLANNISSLKAKIDEKKPSTSKPTEEKPLPPDVETEPGTETSEEDTTATKQEFADWLKARYNHLKSKEIDAIVEYATNLSDHHLFVPNDLGDSTLYSFKQFGSKVLIELNYTHPFYKRFFDEIENSSNTNLIRSFRLLIGALVNSQLSRPTSSNEVKRDRRDGHTLFATKLADYIEDLYQG